MKKHVLTELDTIEHRDYHETTWTCSCGHTDSVRASHPDKSRRWARADHEAHASPAHVVYRKFKAAR